MQEPSHPNGLAFFLSDLRNLAKILSLPHEEFDRAGGFEDLGEQGDPLVSQRLQFIQCSAAWQSLR
jgi:hypothetical protein